LGDVLFERDCVAKFTFAVAPQFLKAREIGLCCGETPRCGSEFDGEVFAGFGNSF